MVGSLADVSCLAGNRNRTRRREVRCMVIGKIIIGASHSKKAGNFFSFG